MAIVGEAHVIVRAITTGFKSDVESSLKSVNGSFRQMGEKSGRDFSNSISKGMGGGGGKNPFQKWISGSDAARKKFNSLTKAGYVLGPALAGSASAISSLVSGLFAVASAAGAAAPALVVLPGILTAVVQAGIAAKLAFMGVGKAISALLKQKSGAGAGGSDNSKQIADARKALARVYQQSADQMASANDKVRKAQVALNQAYEKGAESLQQLGFDAEDAAIAQGKAALELERARETLMRVQDLPANNRARREAEMAFQEADLNYRQAVDRSADLAKAQEYAARTGIEGTEEVLSAKEDLADAEADRAKTIRDNAQQEADALENLQDALNKTKTTTTTVADALAGLPKSAADFALFIAGLKPEFDKLRAAAADGLFPKLTIAIQTLVDNLFPRLIPILYDTSSAIGDVAIKFANMLTTTENMDRIDRIFGDTNIKVIEDLGGAAVALGEGLLIVLDAARPLVEEFAEWVRLTTEGWTETLKAKEKTGELAGVFESAGDAAKIIGETIGSTAGAFFELGKGAKDSGLKIIEAFGGAMDKLKIFAEEGNKTGELPAKFDQIADSVIAIGAFVGELTKLLFDLGGNPGVTAFFEQIKVIPGILGGAAGNLAGTGESIGKFLVSLSKLIAKLTETGGIEIFFKILTKALDVVNAIFSNDTVTQVFGYLAVLKGVTLAFGVIGSVVSFFGQVLFNTFSAAFKIIGKLWKYGVKPLTQALIWLGKAFWAATGPIGLIVLAIVGLIALFVHLYKNNEKFREIVDKVWNAIKDAIGAAIDAIIGFFKGMIEFGMKIWNFLVEALEPVIEAVKAIFNAYIGFWKAIVETIIGIGLIIWNFLSEKLTAIWAVVKGYWDNTIMPFFSGIVSAVSGVASKIWNFISDKLTAIWAVVKGYWDNTIMPFFSGIVSKVSGIAGGIWDFISGGISDAWNKVKSFFNEKIYPFIEGIKDKISDIGKNLWDGLKSGLVRVVNGVIKTLNQVIDGLNLLIKGANAVKTGPDIKLLSKLPMVELARGGVVQPTPGGTIARIAEAGRPERVEPLDSQGLSVRDRAIIAQLSGGGTSGASPTFNIYPSERMDERALASIVSRNVMWGMRRGA